MYRLNDDIVALATIAGKSALNVVRVSGPSSLDFYKKLTKLRALPRPNYVKLLSLYHPIKKQNIDQATVIYYKGPKSFTGEDCIEITTHGGVIIVNQLLDALLILGAREALPGEFSYRAFINNKIDLLQAEAIPSIVNATNDLDSYYALNSIKGTLSSFIQKSHNTIKRIVTIGEHELDFNEDEINFTKHATYIRELKKATKIIKNIINQSYTMEDDKSGFKIVITGLPNVGKSSLFNLLVGRSRAIVTSQKGTTRDILEQSVYIKDNLVTLIDTAGIRKTKDKIEKIGIKKSLQEITKADILLVVDDIDPFGVFEKIKGNLNTKSVILIQNKTDINAKNKNKKIINLSCKNKTGTKKLITLLSTTIQSRADVFSQQHSCLINKRQKKLLNNIYNGLLQSSEEYKTNKDLSLCLSLLYGVLNDFNTLVRPTDKNQILNDIFGGFCVGK